MEHSGGASAIQCSSNLTKKTAATETKPPVEQVAAYAAKWHDSTHQDTSFKSQEELMDDIASVMLRLAEYETRSSDDSQQSKQSPASWKSTQCTATKVVATLGWLQAYAKEERAEEPASEKECCEKLWRLLGVMLTGHLRDDNLDVRKVFLQAMEPLADVWRIVKGSPIAENIENLGLALMKWAVWDDTLFRAKAIERLCSRSTYARSMCKGSEFCHPGAPAGLPTVNPVELQPDLVHYILLTLHGAADAQHFSDALEPCFGVFVSLGSVYTSKDVMSREEPPMDVTPYFAMLDFTCAYSTAHGWRSS
ncbi:hypothetical protein WJX77_011942 [Trebouxia sp. C0004]